jgi:hypothetical protein
MQKIVLKYGLISGLLIALMMSVTVPFQDKISGHGYIGYITGYTTMVLSFLLVYFGIRSYRDQVGGGQISFGRGFAVGMCIMLITCIFYVVTWEIIYFNFMHDFMDKYAAHVIEKARAAGASAAAIQAKTQQMEAMKKMYENPMYNAAITFIEPFPVGLLIALISAAVLRRKAGVGALRTAELG